MNFIRKIFENKIDDDVHKQFRRFSKGSFENRAVVEIAVSKNIKIKTSFEYTNELVRLLANTIKDKVHVTGGIITVKDITKYIDFDVANIKQFAGVKTYQIDCMVSRGDLLKALDNFSDAVFCLSFSTDYGSLKIKVKSPKAAKTKKGGEGIKADYCSLVTNDINLKNDFAFDVKNDFRRFTTSHDFIINELVVPEEHKNDFEKARIYARRKGKIIRRLDIDGKQLTKEVDFEI